MLCADYVINLGFQLLYSAIQPVNWENLAGWQCSDAVSGVGGRKCILICVGDAATRRRRAGHGGDSVFGGAETYGAERDAAAPEAFPLAINAIRRR